MTNSPFDDGLQVARHNEGLERADPPEGPQHVGGPFISKEKMPHSFEYQVPQDSPKRILGLRWTTFVMLVLIIFLIVGVIAGSVAGVMTGRAHGSGASTATSSSSTSGATSPTPVSLFTSQPTATSQATITEFDTCPELDNKKVKSTNGQVYNVTCDRNCGGNDLTNGYGGIVNVSAYFLDCLNICSRADDCKIATWAADGINGCWMKMNYPNATEGLDSCVYTQGVITAQKIR